jgi:hypothetical protein
MTRREKTQAAFVVAIWLLATLAAAWWHWHEAASQPCFADTLRISANCE